jgi:DNA-binding XRE family transcriptional regulator
MRRAHAVVRQSARLTYAPPALTVLPPALDAQIVGLADARRMASLSIPDLARSSQVSPATIYRIEHSKTRPRPHVVHALSRALGRSPAEIAEFRDLVAADPFRRALS